MSDTLQNSSVCCSLKSSKEKSDGYPIFVHLSVTIKTVVKLIRT